MFGRYSEFFLQSDFELYNAKQKLIVTLGNLGRNENEIKEYVEAYDYFSKKKNKKKFDGSTGFRDLFVIIHNGHVLDIDSARHDLDYILGANRSFVRQWKSDVKYLKNSLANGKGFLWFRFLLLRVLSIGYIPFRWSEYQIKKMYEALR